MFIEQLEQIKRISLARIVCDNNEGSVQSIQPLTMKAARDLYNNLKSASNLKFSYDMFFCIYPFLLFSNRAVHCSSIPKLDLSSWIGETIF